ncbi:phosphoglycerol transferase MdoB-like AlkP superfamily enzyme [Pasteurella langaaensis DSM 22999]|uniref:Phosphoglycerol transferase MdoB-like AlkP superfamily enzyme n=1 Tax=Alitibacter langaaensis DSM 22999 TaxID=1122935 RepID=A0A2U0SMS7_9PAST|nr:LTA synthase family protein [Pasteurella langaaensis]PVX32656.1 phosphoglycerol transferase MdoB-like AlkP superfamily enzyme [Pasteurella langaaensis DSM 22999]
MLKRSLGAIYPIFIFFITNLILLSCSRVLLGLWQKERVDSVDGWLPMLLQGVRIDVSALCWLFAPLVIIALFLGGKNALGKGVDFIVRLGLTAFSTFIIFMEIATPPFIETYDTRPNRLFIEYLIYPKEVFNMLANGHLVALIVTLIFTALSAWVFWKFAKKLSQNLSYFSWKWRPVAFLLIGGLMFLGARSSLQHRGINPSMVAFSSDPLVNALTLNSGYSVMFALQQLSDEENSSEIYGKMDFEEIIKTLKDVRGRPESDYISSTLPTLTTNHATYQGKPKNIVIILEESFGAQFVGTLGGRPLSPNFDKLAQQGWLFENLYATGTRSVRGIEAVTTGFTPTPARAVVKLTGAQTGFFSIADVLSKQGYNTSFIYGGEKHFDNMASFFYGNGFQQIIDEGDYKNPKFTSTWGVSDEDLFDKAHEKFTALAKENSPFFSLVFTSSNHDPFDFPEGKIELYEQPQKTRNNAAKYADYALGHFFDLAKKSDYWKDTIFLVIADHDSRAGGAAYVPVNNFHIPALILGNGIPVQRDNRLVSQIDMPTTLLSLAGINANYPMLGYDLTKENPNRALMQYNKVFGYMREINGQKELAILQEKKPIEGFKYDTKNQVLIPTDIPEEMKNQALAYALWGSIAYKEKLYRSEPQNNAK